MKPICVRAITGDTLHGCLPSLSAKSRTWKSAGVRERLKENTRGKQRRKEPRGVSYFKERRAVICELSMNLCMHIVCDRLSIVVLSKKKK